MISRNILFTSISRVVFLGAGFILNVYLSRVLGSTLFGWVNMASAIMGYFLLLGNLGVPLYSTREIAKKSFEIGDFLSRIIPLRFVLIGGSSLLALAVGLLVFGLTPFGLYFILLVLSHVPVIVRPGFLFRGIERMDQLGTFNMFHQLLYLGLILLVVTSRGDFIYIPVCSIAVGLALTVIYNYYIHRLYGRVTLALDPPFWKEVIKSSIPIGLSYFIVRMYYNADTIMLGFFYSYEEVGLYSAAYKVIRLVLSLRVVLVFVFFPVMARLFVNNREDLRRLVILIQKFVLVVILPVAAVMVFYSDEIIVFIFGPEYLGGSLALKLLTFTAVILTANTVYPGLFNACDRSEVYFKGHMVIFGINILFNLALIPYYGIVGAAVTTILCDLFSFVYFYNQTKKLIIRVDLLAVAYKPLLAGAAFWAALWPIRDMGPITAPGLLSLAYVLLILALRIFSVEEVKWARSLMGAKTVQN